MKLFHVFILFLLINCSSPKEHSYSFYYWRTEWNLDKKEQENLKKSQSKTIYTRFFDIDKKEGRFAPVGKIHFSQKNDLQFVDSKKNLKFAHLFSGKIVFIYE